MRGAARPASEAALPAPLRLEALLDRCQRLGGAARLGFDELRELARLYRAQSSRLARLRDRDADPDAIRHVNALCVRAHGLLYSASGSGGPSRRGGPGAGGGWRSQAVALLGRTWRAQALAWLLLLAGAALGSGLTLRDPNALYALLPVQFGYSAERVDRLWSSREAREDFLAHDDASAGSNAFFGSRLFAHNTRVGVLSFATGVLAGVPSVLLQLYNGMMLGAFASVFLHAGADGGAWLGFAAWLLPHAIPELTAISLCCAAGLVLGAAVATPGRRSRTRALRAASGPALGLVLGALPLFLLAAGVESFVRQSALATGTRLALAAFFAVALAAGLLASRHWARSNGVDAGWLRELAGEGAGEAGGEARSRGQARHQSAR